MISATGLFSSRNNNNNYLIAGRPFLKHKSLMHPAHTTNHVEYPKPKNSANSLRYPNSNSSHSSKNERKGQSANRSSITKNSLSTENPNGVFVMRNKIQISGTNNNPLSLITKKCSREVDRSSRSSTIHNSKSSENNLRLTNSKKYSTEAENSRSSTIHNSKSSGNSLRLVNSKKRSTEGENSRISTIHNSNNVENNSRPVKRTIEIVNDSRSINSKTRSLEIKNPNSVEDGLGINKKRSIGTGNSRIIPTTHNPMQRSGNEVSRGTTINNLNRVENNSRLANPRKRSIEVENCSSIANPQKRARVENQNNRSTTHNLVQGGSTKINIRAATNRSIVVNSSSNLVQRNGTGNDSRTADPQHSRKLVNSLLPAEFDRFSTQALNKKVKNKDLTKSEWENIRLIKAALINLVESSQKYNRIEAEKTQTL
ncbi:uncharacterized protein OCT59_014346 [Rhizophagus irregularis]|uniref:uncharacterized protein n=1 Tax=Rhizophagus irregularis TaxID=588596 RepID=UPI00331E4F7A|nr:hypothetical protein OCT59_014346 [Rhizophagus irregularis]